MTDRAKINPKVLKWARESARFTVENASEKLPVASSRLLEWEEGQSLPTIRQAEQLAKLYRRPFALLFFPQVPLDFQPLQDYRRPDARPLGTASTFIIREIQQKQAWIKNLHQESEEEPLPFVGRFTINDRPDKVANDILETLKINPSKYNATPIKEWINKAEANGIFISRTGHIHSRLVLDSSELQGFAIADAFASFIFVNSEDWDAPQLFTLVHELAHLWIAASGISSDIESELQHRDQLHPVEIFCNKVAASALMPETLMRKLHHDVFRTHDSVFAASKRFGVSAFAFLYRAYSLQMISNEQYRRMKQLSEKAFQEFVRREEEKKAAQKAAKKGGPDYYLLLVNKNSSLFTKVVLDAFRGGHIQPTEASGLLNTSINNFPKLEAFLYS